MSSNTAFTSSNFDTLFNAALAEYTKKTGKDLRNHPLASKINSCNSTDSILHIFQEQAEKFDEFRKGNKKLFNWLGPIIKVLHAFSTNEILKDTVSHVCLGIFLVIYCVDLTFLSIHQVFPPSKMVLSAIGVLLSVRVSLVLSPPHSLHLGLPDGQACGGRLRRPSRYLRMRRELPQTIQDLYRESAYPRVKRDSDQDNG